MPHPAHWRHGLQHPAAKPLVFTACLLPLLWLLYLAFSNQLGANPAEALIRASGDWALRFLCIALAVTPLRIVTQTPALARYRRMLGLFAWFYALCHLMAYALFDMGLQISLMWSDLAQRPFILVGFMAFTLLSMLAITSPRVMVRTLGGKRWQWLHRSIYLAGLLAILHFYWMRMGKNQFGEVWWYGSILAILLIWRAWHGLRLRSKP